MFEVELRKLNKEIAMDAKAIRLFVDDLESFTKCKDGAERNQLEHLVSYIICCAINNFTAYQVEKVIEAIYVSAKHHEGIRRASGESYLIHPLSVAYFFMLLGLYDFKLTIAAILHDVIEDKTNKRERGSAKREIIERFGEEIKVIAKLVTKKFCRTKQEDLEGREIHFTRIIESDNWRGKLLRIGDRHHNHETLHEMPAENQARKLAESHKYFHLICSSLLSLLEQLEQSGTITYDEKTKFKIVRRIVSHFLEDLNNYKIKEV